jgi:LysM repeat protein
MRNHLWFGTMNNTQIKLLNSSRSIVLLLVLGVWFFAMAISSSQTANDIIDNPNKNKTIPGHGMSQGEYPFDEDGFYRKEWVSTTARSPVNSSTTYKLPIPITSEEHSNYSHFAKGNLKEAKEKAQNSPGETPLPSSPENLSKKSPPSASEEPGNQIIPAMFVMTDAEARSQGFIGPYSKMVETKSVPSTDLSSKRPTPNSGSNTILANQTVVEKPIRKEPTTPAKLPSTLTGNGAVSTASILPPYHQVTNGETLYSISRKYGVSVDSLKKANGLTSDLIRIGQSLRLALAQHVLGVMTR